MRKLQSEDIFFDSDSFVRVPRKAASNWKILYRIIFSVKMFARSQKKSDNRIFGYQVQEWKVEQKLFFFEKVEKVLQIFGFILVSKKCFKTMFNCQKVHFPSCTWYPFFFYLVSFILVLDIRRTYQMSVKMFAPHTVQYFPIAGGLMLWILYR